jgi:SAM-dependent methyltransferase
MLKRISFLYSWLMLRLKVRAVSPEYREYLEMQLRRTLAKKNVVEGMKLRTKILVDTLSGFTDLSKSDVLCIGCRDHHELDYFLSKQAQSVVGIDLQSASSDIVVMDMQNMLFSDDSFDVVYSAHSLEHAYDPNKVASEIIRVARPNAWVAIEVPIQYDVRGADLIDFGNTDNVQKLFGDHFLKAFLSEDLPAGHPRNDGGTSIARTVFQISKKS